MARKGYTYEMPALVSFDASVDRFFELHRTLALNDFFLIVTRLGDARIMIIVVLSLLIVLWRHKKYPYKAGLIVALFGAISSSYLLKILVERPRPLSPIALISEPGYSFPSMHAASSMAAYGFLLYTIYKLMLPPHHRAPVMISLVATIFLVGLSRVYLGVHYPSDVLGGYAIGALFAYLGIAVTRLLERRGREASKAKPSAR